MTQISCIYNLSHGRDDVKTAEQRGSIWHFGRGSPLKLTSSTFGRIYIWNHVKRNPSLTQALGETELCLSVFEVVKPTLTALYEKSAHTLLQTIWMLIGLSAVHFCDAATFIPIARELWLASLNEYKGPESERPLPAVTLHPPLQDNHETKESVAVSEGALLHVWNLYCTVRAMSEPPDCYWKVGKDKCSLRTVLPLLAGCRIGGKSPQRVSIDSTANLLLFCESCMQCSNRLELRRYGEWLYAA